MRLIASPFAVSGVIGILVLVGVGAAAGWAGWEATKSLLQGQRPAWVSATGGLATGALIGGALVVRRRLADVGVSFFPEETGPRST